MRLSFWRGMLAGSIVGALMGLMASPQRKPGGLLWEGIPLRRTRSRIKRKMLRGIVKTLDQIL